jgi:hypothetical protein
MIWPARRQSGSCQSESQIGHSTRNQGLSLRLLLCLLPVHSLFELVYQKAYSACAILARTTSLCEFSRQRHSLRDRWRRLPASCVPHGAPSGLAAATFTPAWSSWLPVLSPLISLLSSITVLSGGCCPPGARAGQASRPALAQARVPAPSSP